MLDAELLKEFLRDAFMDGALDLGVDRKYLEGFVSIFAGEMEAIIAVQHAFYLTQDEQARLMRLAKPTTESVRHVTVWDARARGGTSWLTSIRSWRCTGRTRRGAQRR